MGSNAFSRVRSLLRYARPAQWTAILCGVATALLYALLVLLLALFVDLLVTRGRIPNFAQLPVQEQESVLREWSALPPEDREEALQHVGFGDFRTDSERAEAPPPDQRARWRQYHVLKGGEGIDYPPVPGKATAEDLQAWAAKRQYSGDPQFAAALEHEWRWRAFVWHYLDRRVGRAAADRYQPEIEPGTALTPPGLGEENRTPHGILGLVVRERNTAWGRPAAAFASAAGWTWRGENPNRTYLTGLLVLALVLVLLRGVCLVVMNDAAARAALEVVTRLRRSIYHHAARQGSMTINPESVDEAGRLFTRQVENVHEAMLYALTYSYRYAIFFPLMLLIALLTHFWLTIAFLMFAVIVWALAGLMTASFRRRSRSAARVQANRLELLLESLRQMRLVKSYLMELFNQSRVERQLSDYSRAHLRRTRGDSLVKPLLFAVGGMAAIALFYLSGMVVLHEGLSVAGLVLLTVSFLSLYFPVRSRLSGRRTLRHGREAAAVIYEFLDRKGDVAQYPDADFFAGLSRGVEFADVTVREPGTGRLL